MLCVVVDVYCVGCFVFGMIDMWLLWYLFEVCVCMMMLINVMFVSVYLFGEYCYFDLWFDVFGFLCELLLVLCEDVDVFGYMCVDVFGIDVLIFVCVGD